MIKQTEAEAGRKQEVDDKESVAGGVKSVGGMQCVASTNKDYLEPTDRELS